MITAPPVLYASWVSMGDLLTSSSDHERDLSPDEISYAERYLTREGRLHYAARRAWLRRELATRLHCPPVEIRFQYNVSGKPFVERSSLTFNLSSSNGIVLLVVGRLPTIGCDIEFRDANFDYEPIIQSFFSTSEKVAFRGLPTSLKRTAFYQAWTCKEAYLKAVGCGLSSPLDEFDVEIHPDRPAKLGWGCGGLTVQSFRLGDNFQAAVVAPGAWRLSLRRGRR